MLDDGTTGPSEGDFVQFVQTGTAVSGAYRCSSCGYGVTVRAALPTCPMCSGSVWERIERSQEPGSRRAQTLL